MFELKLIHIVCTKISRTAARARKFITWIETTNRSTANQMFLRQRVTTYHARERLKVEEDVAVFITYQIIISLNDVVSYL